MPITSRNLGKAERTHEFVTDKYDISTNTVEDHIYNMQWSGTMKYIYGIVQTETLVSYFDVDIGYAKKGGLRTSKDVDYFVDAGRVTRGHEIGSVIAFTLAHSKFNKGEIISLSTTKNGSATGKIRFQLGWEYDDAWGKIANTPGSTSTSTTTSTTTTTTSTTTTSSTTSTTSTTTSGG